MCPCVVEETETSDSAVEHQLSLAYVEALEKVDDLRCSGRLLELELDDDDGKSEKCSDDDVDIVVKKSGFACCAMVLAVNSDGQTTRWKAERLVRDAMGVVRLSRYDI